MKRLVILFLVVVSAPARAEEPWVEGVAKADQSKANALFAEANQLFAHQAHPAALEKYKAALAVWDHPLIRFNMAVTLIRLDRFIEAADALDTALRFGDAPFPPELYQQALDYQKLVQGRVGELDASCMQPGVNVMLDGKPWFTCPGTKRERVTAGEHRLAAEGTGLLGMSRVVHINGNARTTQKLELMPIDAAIRLEYPVARWVPWTVAGAGAALGFGGLGLYFSAKNDIDEFRASYMTRCRMGCAHDLSDVPDLRAERDSAERKGVIAVATMVVGGAVTASGFVWAGFFNRPHRITPQLEVAPTTNGMSATAAWRF